MRILRTAEPSDSGRRAERQGRRPGRPGSTKATTTRMLAELAKLMLHALNRSREVLHDQLHLQPQHSVPEPTQPLIPPRIRRPSLAMIPTVDLEVRHTLTRKPADAAWSIAGTRCSGESSSCAASSLARERPSFAVKWHNNPVDHRCMVARSVFRLQPEHGFVFETGYQPQTLLTNTRTRRVSYFRGRACVSRPSPPPPEDFPLADRASRGSIGSEYKTTSTIAAGSALRVSTDVRFEL